MPRLGTSEPATDLISTDIFAISRNFLLFMPNVDSATSLRAVFTFYSDILTLNSEGDSVVSEETLQGLGTNILYTLLGSILRLASPPVIPPDRDHSSSISSRSPQGTTQLETTPTEIPPTSSDSVNIESITAHSYVQPTSVATAITANAFPAAQQTELLVEQDIKIESTGLSEKKKRNVLIKYIPDPGYFVAGAVAGGISRTATAPLDRLKVYLLVNTTASANVALDAAKKGQPIRAIKHAGIPLFTAVSDIYKSGGLRGFFVGQYIP